MIKFWATYLVLLLVKSNMLDWMLYLYFYRPHILYPLLPTLLNLYCIVPHEDKCRCRLPNQQGKHDQKNIVVWCVCMLYMMGGKMPLMLYLARDIPLETGFLLVMFYRVFLTKNGRPLLPFFFLIQKKKNYSIQSFLNKKLPHPIPL